MTANAILENAFVGRIVLAYEGGNGWEGSNRTKSLGHRITHVRIDIEDIDDAGIWLSFEGCMGDVFVFPNEEITFK